MAHTEAQIRKAIKPLLAVYGELNTTEVKTLLNTVLLFDSDDITPSPTRPGEVLILQRIGNIVAHQVERVKIYDEGFVLDKTTRPAKFKLYNSITNSVIPVTQIKKLKKRTKRFIARKVDWDKLRERNNEIGDQGEEFVLEFEIDRLKELNLDYSQVQHLSRFQGDGLGFDIFSVNIDGTPRYIEVKTTSGDLSHPFYMSRNEKFFFEEYSNSAFIYRVYDFDINTRFGKIKIISQKELFTEFIFDTITWQVIPRLIN